MAIQSFYEWVPMCYHKLQLWIHLVAGATRHPLGVVCVTIGVILCLTSVQHLCHLGMVHAMKLNTQNFMKRIHCKNALYSFHKNAMHSFHYLIAKESFIGGSFMWAEIDYFESGEALCCSAWCFNCCTVCKPCLLVVIGEGQFHILCIHQTVCQQYIIIGNMCNVNYACHINYV